MTPLAQQIAESRKTCDGCEVVSYDWDIQEYEGEQLCQKCIQTRKAYAALPIEQTSLEYEGEAWAG